MTMTNEELREQIAKHNWYHRIELAPGIITPGVELFDRICDFIYENQKRFDYAGKSVLDIGARDCLHSIRAKALGAGRVVAFDNDLSVGARDLALPLLAPDVVLRHQNLYDLEERGEFDIVQFFGVIYHLRFPFNGLQKVAQAAKIGGLILVEGGMLVDAGLEPHPLLYCPASKDSPYDPSSVTFFNAAGLTAAMETFGCVRVSDPVYWESSGSIRRGFIAYRKTEDVSHGYWQGLHTYHTRLAHANSDWKADQK